MTTLDRLLLKLRADADGCWIWHGAISSGYGIVRHREKTARAHRAVYEEMVEPIPAGSEIHHVCEKKLCCNPAHLIPMSRSEHLKERGRPKNLQRYCPNGHAYDEAGVRLDPRGHRRCQICEKANNERHYHTRKAAIRERNRAWYERNKEKIREYNRKYHERKKHASNPNL